MEILARLHDYKKNYDKSIVNSPPAKYYGFQQDAKIHQQDRKDIVGKTNGRKEEN